MDAGDASVATLAVRCLNFVGEGGLRNTTAVPFNCDLRASVAIVAVRCGHRDASSTSVIRAQDAGWSGLPPLPLARALSGVCWLSSGCDYAQGSLMMAVGSTYINESDPRPLLSRMMVAGQTVQLGLWSMSLRRDWLRTASKSIRWRTR